MAEAKSLFQESLEHHQALVDVLVAHRGEDGVCRISREQLEAELGRNWRWICKAIDRINTLDKCIRKVDAGAYLVAYDNLLMGGIFRKIGSMLLNTVDDPLIVRMTNLQLMVRFDCSEKVVQMYRAYALSGWKVAVRKGLLDGEEEQLN